MSAVLGVLFAALIGLLMIPTYMHFETVSIDNTKATTTAQQMRQVSQAAQGYIRANYSAVSESSPATITVSMLKNTGYLPNDFQNENPFGQKWQVQVLKLANGQLQTLVLSQGGSQIGQKEAPMIAAQAGAEGGFIPYNGQYGTLNDTVAEGSYSGWQVSLSGYSNPGPGHLAALLVFNNGNLENNYLYRVAVPGQPQLNTMQTTLNMGTNNITGVNNTITAGTVSASGQVSAGYDAVVGTANGTAQVGALCSTDNAIAVGTNSSGLLLCQNGTWQQALSSSGGLNSGMPGTFQQSEVYTEPSSQVPTQEIDSCDSGGDESYCYSTGYLATCVGEVYINQGDGTEPINPGAQDVGDASEYYKSVTTYVEFLETYYDGEPTGSEWIDVYSGGACTGGVIWQ